MSGVYIPGMEMPKPELADTETVYGAFILVRPSGHVEIVVDNEGGLDSTAYPLVPVPDHGRLIDADEIIKYDYQHYEYLSDTFYVTVRDIELAPTIIEADKQYPEWRTQILGKPYRKDEEGE